jgi:hypothetical protein
LATSERRTVLRLALEVVREPMFLLLLAAGGLYVAFGDIQEALTLLGFVVIVMTITIVQEGRTERALDALRDLTSPRAQVLRDGVVVTLPARELVPGDVIRVAEGDRVAAGAVLREGTALSVDESLLTHGRSSRHGARDRAPRRDRRCRGHPGVRARGARRRRARRPARKHLDRRARRARPQASHHPRAAAPRARRRHDRRRRQRRARPARR